MMPDSPLIDALQLAEGVRERVGQMLGELLPANISPEVIRAAIECAMWGGIADYYAAAGGHPDDGGHILRAISPIVGICPMREMGLLC
jgi:hypothetical protein